MFRNVQSENTPTQKNIAIISPFACDKLLFNDACTVHVALFTSTFGWPSRPLSQQCSCKSSSNAKNKTRSSGDCGRIL